MINMPKSLTEQSEDIPVNQLETSSLQDRELESVDVGKIIADDNNKWIIPNKTN